ncbi:MAG TPA: 50S ribosomal protein L29 [Candidatus Atribacteria bacterium]|jgi:large subunit ribosomal protein L29|uniref:50S ribosomal protein L29 n=1 Tax=Candidatus Sordicultor fermentans TaxID=1953203 RepID=UPI0016961231|nr:50S ribosomal protein L29 [Atribacterota bacterium]NLY06180.1 50S ribosomal protein L29 [Candidatus Atribacteria bacterium]MDI9607798.1 50S ribosomal protein L29 [Atribacterota bacterium]MDY0134863.1 50S ribosomal protein L29 [Atribacterota bacterium]HOA98729.1 50S ribosomal protein L29 [Candidatus Atribacteria bacterium]
MKALELRNLTNEELNQRFKDLRTELFNLRFQSITGQLGNPKRIKMVKKDIARVKTILRERELSEEKQGVK